MHIYRTGGCYAGRRPMTEDECQVFARAAEKIAEERSMERIASTFRTAAAAAAEDYMRRVAVYDDFGPTTVGSAIGEYTPPHAMPLLPDFPTRSRRLLENLQGSSPITDSMFSDGDQKSMQKKVNFLDVL